MLFFSIPKIFTKAKCTYNMLIEKHQKYDFALEETLKSTGFEE